MKITVLAFFDRIALYHTLQPLLSSAFLTTWREVSAATPPIFHLTDSLDFCLNRDTNPVLLMVRTMLKDDRITVSHLEQLRTKYRRIIFFNGNAGGGIHRPEVLPYVDRFYNKALFTDQSRYDTSLYGGEAFSDYYHRVNGINDDRPYITGPVPPEQRQKLFQHWNIGSGVFPRRRLVQRGGVWLARHGLPQVVRHSYNIGVPNNNEVFFAPDGSRPIDLHYRVGAPGYNSIRFHRQTLGSVLQPLIERMNLNTRTGKASHSVYWQEMQSSKIVFSPFGWGEVCFRDFEAIRAGALLLKPDMSHLQTFPDVYRPFESYVPVNWDGSDIEAKLDYYLSHEDERLNIATRAQTMFAEQLAQASNRAVHVVRGMYDGVQSPA